MSRLIDADALRAQMYHEAFETDTDMQRWDGGCWIRYKMFENAIDNAPTIEPQRMRGKGRWNVYYHGEENGKSIFSYSCNQCGYGAPYNFIGGVCEQKKWNFCPNCGADMRGSE